jgi:predicted O-methyltransferase YrrM
MKERYEILTELIRKHGWTYGAELGIASGTNLTYLLKNNPNLNMTAVDSYLPFPRHNARHQDILYQTAKDRVSKYSDRVVILKTTTTQASAQLLPGSLDFIFIDADHSFEAVLEDLQNWYDIVKTGGWLLGHDWCPGEPGVQRAVEHFISTNKLDVNLVLFDSAVWGFQKEEK